MTKTQRAEALNEVLHEIRRLNAAAGHTVFNPAATDCVKALLAQVEA